MAQSIVISQGKGFTVELQSMYGSSAYGWCLSTLPKGIILTGTENEKVPSAYQIGPVNQKFYFAAVSSALVTTLEFVLTAAFCPADVKDTYVVDVQVVPATTQEFVPYSENAMSNVKYGYVCAGQAPVTDYGFINEGQNDLASLKYGYPCNASSIKYGYPCTEEPAIKYGYPCGYNDAAVQANKPFINEGIPANKPFINECMPVNKPFINECVPANKPFINGGMPVNKPFINGNMAVNKPFINDSNAMNVAMPYGMVYADDCIHKYGFPNC